MITIGLLIGFLRRYLRYQHDVLPSGFIPTEDQGVINVNVTTPVGSYR
jgi:HAE1 family hydrophobic/amphiphilic exporter-1